MLHTSTSSLAPTGNTTPPSSEIIQSRFGQVVVDMSKVVEFSQGLLGMPEMLRFALTHFPSEKMQQFMLLQSVDDKSISFITLPIALENPVITTPDLRNACKELHISEADLAALLIVSVHRSMSEVKLSVNARAPLLIDATRRIGAQYVFQNDRYKVQHML